MNALLVFQYVAINASVGYRVVGSNIMEFM